MSKALFFSFFFILLFVGTASAQLYQWVDENGVTHLSDRPPKSPKSKDSLEVIPRPRSNAQPPADGSRANPARGDAQPVQGTNVELYTTSWCVYCKKARLFFRSRGIPFTEYDIEKNKSAALRKKRLDKKGGVPFAMINGQPVHGFSKAAYESALRQSR